MKNKSKKIMIVLGITILIIAVGITLPIIVKGDNNDAGTSQVLSGKTFTNGSAVAVVGTMTDYSETLVTKSVEALNSNHIETIELEPGYYTSVQMDTTPVYNAGYNEGYNTFDSTRYKVLETGTFNTGNIPINDGYVELNLTLQNNYTSAQNARFIITGYRTTVGTLSLYFNVGTSAIKVEGNTKKVPCINGAGTGYNPAYGAATVNYMIIGYPAE